MSESVVARLVDPPRFREFRLRLARCFRTVLPWCVPALVLAAAIRIVIVVQMPSAFIHNDTASIVETADRLVHRGALEIEGKKTFLVPLVYSIPAVVRIPILPFVAVVQHLLGIAAVLVCGLIVRLWFSYWRILILPTTLLVAIQPVMLWYEHAALAETWAIFGILLVALGATAFWRDPNRYSLILFFLTLLFMAGARPEGRLFALFAIVLVGRAFWGNWKSFRVAVPATCAWAVLLFLITRTGQSGLLLFTSVIQLTPDTLVLSPGVAEATHELAEQARADWSNETEAPKLVRLRKALQDALVEMQVRNGVERDDAEDRTNKIASRAGLETAARSPFDLPDLAIRKFVIAHREPPALEFNEYAVSGQLGSLIEDGKPLKAMKYGSLLWGQSISDGNEARALLESRYNPVPGDFPWWLQQEWLRVTLIPALPWNLPGSAVEGVPFHGVPWLYFAGLLGLICLAVREPGALNFHQLWGAFLIALFILIMVTANIRARFRVLFEPIWLLYAFALADTALALAHRLFRRKPDTAET